MKRIAVIGGGIAGLSAGVYALLAGYDVTIYEKNADPGGECMGWNRQGYHIDNCIHWLTGCNPGDDLYQIWCEIGALAQDTLLIREPYFYCLEMDGTTLHFWSDPERARKEFLDTAPEDAVEINRFFDCVRMAESVRVPCEKSLAEMKLGEYMKFGMSMADMGRVIREYGKDTIDDLANRFGNPCVREMMRRYLNPACKAITLLSSYAFYTSKTAAIPAGGSVGMVERIVSRYRELGGRICTSMAAERVNVSHGKAQSVSFADGSTVDCDYVVCATDPAVTFGGLLDPGYMDRKLRKMYAHPEGYKVFSLFGVSFGIRGKENCADITGSIVFPCERFTVGTQKIDYLSARMYDYDKTLFPADRRVIRCSIPQDSADYAYWNEIYHEKERYLEKKQEVAEAVRERLIRHFPVLQDRLILLDTYSPVTFTKWCGAYQGAYMSFFEQQGYKSLTVKNSIKGLSNVFLASQWLTTNGGLPMAVTSGKFAVQALLKQDGKK